MGTDRLIKKALERTLIVRIASLRKEIEALRPILKELKKGGK